MNHVREAIKHGPVLEHDNGTYPEEARVAEFMENLLGRAIKPLTTEADPSLPDPALAATQEFFATEFQQEPTFYVVPEIADTLRTELTGFTRYVTRPSMQSRHKVFFGALTLSDGAELPVAVKPLAREDFEKDIDPKQACLDDYFINEAAQRAGFETLEPVGFILSEDGLPFSVTVLNESLINLEETKWTRFFDPEFETTGMVQQLHGAAEEAADVHSKGDSRHGDLALRNIATNLEGETFFIDWEFGKISTATPVDMDVRMKNTYEDIKKLMESTVDAGLYTHRPGDYWEAFREVFLDDYIEARKRLGNQNLDDGSEDWELQAELSLLEFDLQKQMEKWSKTPNLSAA